MFFSNTTEKRALKFVNSNGPALAQHIAYNVANSINELKDTTWGMLEKFNQQDLFLHKDDATAVFLNSFMAIRIELEMRAVNNKFGAAVCKRLASHVANHIKPTIGGIFPRLMKDAYETLEENRGKDFDIILSELCNKILGSEKKIHPALFYPLLPILTEGGNLTEIISNNI